MFAMPPRRFILLPGLLLLVWTLLMALPALCEQHAVLIGVKDYPNVKQLMGPLNDVDSMKAMLTSRYGFSDHNVTTLVEGQATKDNILSTLSRLTKTTKSGDFIFVFFSGHGTSGLDPTMEGPMGDATGALIPYDFNGERKDRHKTLASIIIGKRDLRPILAELDKGRRLLVVFDACYSGHTVRDTRQSKGIPKFVDLGLGDDFPAAKSQPRKREPYPYENLIYISAADEHEMALDTDEGPSSFDGKPHGVLTNALLHGLAGAADTNRDGTVTYEELHRFAQQRVGSFGQTPQIHHGGMLNRGVFERDPLSRSVAPPSRGIPFLSETLRVKAAGKERELTDILEKIQAIQGITVVGEGYDLLLHLENGKASISLPGGDKLAHAATVDEAVTRIIGYVKIRELLRLKNPTQDFNARLETGPHPGKTVFQEGETLDFTIRSERSAFLLLLNVNPVGDVQVLLPESGTSEARAMKGVPFHVRGLGAVSPPLGVEYLKLFAFSGKVDGLQRLASGDGALNPAGKDFAELLELLKNRSDWAESIQQVTTTQGK
jgi:hypothetical protein